MYDASKAKQWLLQYLKIEGRADLIQIVKSIPDKLVSTTPGWLAKMSLNGTKLAAENKEWIVSRIEEMGAKRLRLDEEVSEDPLQPKAKVPVDIQARTKIKNDNLLSDAEEQVIDNRGSMYDFLQKYVATPAAARYLLQYYQPIYDEVMSEDEQVIEAFGKKLKAERTFMQTLIDDLNRYIGNKKATKIRKAPTRKEKPLAKQIEKLKFQKEFAPLKIVSVNPVEIVGCQQLWTYNTKYKKLTRYDALGPAGIQVKGTTLIGYDVE
jgi:fumarate hydratase class II